MRVCIKRYISIIYFLTVLISDADSHDMTMQDELQETHRKRAEELQEIQEERASELQEYQDKAIEDLNQVDVRKHRKRERRQEKVFDHRPVFKDDLHNKNYNRTRKKEF